MGSYLGCTVSLMPTSTAPAAGAFALIYEGFIGVFLLSLAGTFDGLALFSNARCCLFFSASSSC